ncbi:hypothetical protein HPB48_000809 [Haemaphysalis longicornis]|uniref:Major facilitator superfamily (MFS) profile domain-containing protein n=1 Tax=Haemaphysalis longicornis TaxID=44386 RepID=A0A9J6FM99_HAELO|nr:hypothetical protein HPB48_000809 [Haemaphysalis longicornis]
MMVDIETSEGFDCEEAFGSGHFQNRIVVFTAISNFVMLTHAIAFPLISTDVDHWCRQPTGWNLSANTWKSIAIPLKSDGRYSQCTVYANPGDPNDTKAVECDAWDYDLERVNTSIVSEWNMVCNRRSLKLLGNAAFMAGSIVFLLLSGYIADTFGRLPVVLGSATVLIMATLASCFAPSYPVYLGSRFLLSGCTISLCAVTGTILAETTSCARRSTSLSVALLMGHSLADTWAAILKSVRPFHWFYIQLAIVAPTLLVPVFFLLATESPRWLIASRRLEAAGRLMRTAAELNRVQSDGVTLLLERVERRLKAEIGMDVRTARATDMARVARRRAAIMFWSLFCVIVAYRSLLLLRVRKSTDFPWMNWASICANVLAYCFVLKFGNLTDRTRLITIAFLNIGTLCLLGSIAELAGIWVSSLDVVSSVVLILAEATSNATIFLNIVYVIELFPTPIRAIAVCLSYVGARLGSTVGFLLPSLTGINHEDLTFALIASVEYSAAYCFQYLPREYGTYARLADADPTPSPSVDSRRYISPVDAMKCSISPLRLNKKSATKSPKKPRTRTS